MKLEQIYTGCLAEAAYYIESNGEAVIIDPLRETEPYIQKLEKEGAKLKYIFETHFHADFVSGHLDLAKKTGATIVYGPNAETAYDIYQAKDGEELSVGELTFKVLHTPGHTLESTTYLLKDAEGNDHAIFTGDTLFLGDVGRPDLAIKQGKITKEDLAEMLYNSLRTKIMPLADEVIVYPAHGAGSACGKNLSSETWGLLGEQKNTNYALRADMTMEEFVREVTTGLMPAPQYFAKNAMLNKTGYESFDEVLATGAVSLSPEKFEGMVENHDALMLDTRNKEVFAKEHIPNSIFVGLDGSFAPWIGALIKDLHQPIVIIADAGKEKEVVTRLARVGYDNSLGYLEGGLEAWKASGKETDSVSEFSAEQIAGMKNANDQGIIVDVRKPGEFVSQHVQEAINIPLDYINSNMHKMDREKTYHLHCLSGYRSMIMASILKSRGFHNINNIQGGWQALSPSGIPITNYVCPTEIPQEIMDKAVAQVV